MFSCVKLDDQFYQNLKFIIFLKSQFITQHKINMTFTVRVAWKLIRRMYKMSARRKAYLDQKKKEAETLKRTLGQDIGTFYDAPPAKKMKMTTEAAPNNGSKEERTLDGAIKVKEEIDIWGRPKESFDEVSEGTTVISNVAYHSNYDLPEPVDFNQTRHSRNN